MRVRSPWMLKVAATVFARVMQCNFRTLRLGIHQAVEGTSPYESTGDARYFYCVWHDSMVVPAFGGPQFGTAALTSRHQDGSFVAAVLRVLRMSTIRGSTNHGGADAVRRMLATEKHIVMTPDGPRGPRRQVSRGIVFLASHSGRAIVPTVAACQRAWHIRGSWTDLMIPRPFSRVVLMAGAPIAVPARLTESELDMYVARVQVAMDNLSDEAERRVRGDAVQSPVAAQPAR